VRHVQMLSGPSRALLVALPCMLLAQGVDHAMKLQQIIGSAKIAASESKFDNALSKLDALEKSVAEWRKHLQDAKVAATAPAEPEREPEPPAESIEFEVNITHTPKKCTRKAEEGAVMKVHYVGKITKTKKIFASSFHTGSLPYRFILGSDEVIDAWNQGLLGMCEGERRRLMVPWSMGYGAKGQKEKGVPPYADLQFDFELAELSNPKIPKSKKKTEL